MKSMRRAVFVTLTTVFTAALLSVGASRCDSSVDSASGLPGQPDLSGARLITILQTNDMHGALEPTVSKDGTRTGGLAMFSGVVQSIRQGLNDQFGSQAGVLVVDGGDQYQGTLVSNFNEGALMFKVMGQIGYDAAIPGNHGYDFGPEGWLDDLVTPTTKDQNPRGVITKLSRSAKFPLLSANTYLRDSFYDVTGKKIPVANVDCKPEGNSVIDWSRVKRPDYIRPYVIKTVAGVRVALVGIDSDHTSETTSIANIQDLCFGDEAGSYERVREEIGDQADVFIMILHDGNTPTERKDGPIKVAQILGAPGKTPLVDAIVAAHTHVVQEDVVNGIPIVQSGSSAKSFGRIDLVWDLRARALDRSRTRLHGGIDLFYDACSPKAAQFCQVEQAASAAAKSIRYEGRVTTPDPVILGMINEGEKAVAPISDRKLGVARNKLWGDRIHESPLANVMTDTLREFAQADVAFINTGGLREPIAPGVFTYSDLFSVLPFNNRAVIVEPMPVEKLLALLLRSAKTCGVYGALMQSGLKVEVEKVCPKTAAMDEKARLLRVETLSGEVILDVRNGIQMDVNRTFKVATLDFLATGGSGYSDFIGTPVTGDLGILREKMTDFLLAEANRQGRLVEFPGTLDGRWKETPRPQTATGEENQN